MCGGSKPASAPPPPPPPPPPPKLVSPDEATGNSSTTKASQTARAKLRIDLDPVAASASVGSSTGLGIPG